MKNKNKNKNSKIKKLTTLIENEHDHHDNKIKEHMNCWNNEIIVGDFKRKISDRLLQDSWGKNKNTIFEWKNHILSVWISWPWRMYMSGDNNTAIKNW